MFNYGLVGISLCYICYSIRDAKIGLLFAVGIAFNICRLPLGLERGILLYILDIHYSFVSNMPKHQWEIMFGLGIVIGVFPWYYWIVALICVVDIAKDHYGLTLTNFIQYMLGNIIAYHLYIVLTLIGLGLLISINDETCLYFIPLMLQSYVYTQYYSYMMRHKTV